MKSPILLARPLRCAVVAGLSLAMLAPLEGCTAIGFGVGAVADTKVGIGGIALLDSSRVGQRVRLGLRSGHRVEGRFAGWSRDSLGSVAMLDTLPGRRARTPFADSLGDAAIPADSISTVSTTQNSFKVVGLLVGITLDVLAYRAAVNSANEAAAKALGDAFGFGARGANGSAR